MIVFIAIVFLLVSVFQKGYCAEVCQTAACVKTAARVMESMNETVNPCDDFFEFACKGWIKKNPIPPNTHTISTMDIIQREVQTNVHKILDTPDNDEDGKPIKLARAMYRTCMDEESVKKLGYEPLNDALTKLGLPHGPPSDDEAKNLNIPKIVALASRFYGMGIFINMQILQNSTDSTKNQLTIEQISPAYDKLDIYLRDTDTFKANVQNVRNFAKTIFTAGGGADMSEEYTNELMDFMTKIAKIMGTPTDRIGTNYISGIATIDELQQLTDPHGVTWNWTEFFKGIFEQTDIIVDSKNDDMFVNDAYYFRNFTLLLNETSPGTTARYVWWEIYFKYRQLVYGPFLTTPRWQACTTIVQTHFDTVLTAAYVKKHFDEEYKKKAMEMWADISSTFDEMITELDWMDAETKAQAHKKVLAVRAFIGYPEWITHPAELEKYYEEWKVLDGKLFDTYVQHQLIRGKQLLNSWRQTPDKNKWALSGTSVNAMYMPDVNAVAITAGMMHIPLYGNEVESLNYGAMGMIMGGQLTHSVDNIGRRSDENGNVRQWWSEQTWKPYLEKIHCIIKQFSELVITQLGKGFKLHGIRFQDESIADIAGLKIAFRAYKKFKARSEQLQALPALDKYTDEQLLFLGFAQTFCGSETDVGLKILAVISPHAPNHYRVIETLQNSVEFAEAWKCPVDTPMNPKNKCIVW